MNRFNSLVKREIMTSQKDLTTLGLVIVLLLFTSETISSLAARFSGSNFPPEVYNGMFPTFLMLGGFIMTSMLFAKDMFGKDSQHDWLMLPATNLEKYLSKVSLMTIAYPLVLIVLFFVASVVIEPIQLLIFGNPMAMFNPFRLKGILTLFAQYWVWNSVFMLGATYFHKAHFIKTVLAIGVIFIGLGALALLYIRIVFAIKFGSSMPVFNRMFTVNFAEANINLQSFRVFVDIGKIIYYGLLPIFCLVTAYFRVEEVQATDAV